MPQWTPDPPLPGCLSLFSPKILLSPGRGYLSGLKFQVILSLRISGSTGWLFGEDLRPSLTSSCWHLNQRPLVALGMGTLTPSVSVPWGESNPFPCAPFPGTWNTGCPLVSATGSVVPRFCWSFPCSLQQLVGGHVAWWSSWSPPSSFPTPTVFFLALQLLDHRLSSL